MLKRIKHSIAARFLRQQVQHLQRKLQPVKFRFEDIRTVGILFDAANTEDFELLKRYVTYLREHRKKVKVLGYFSTKEIPSFSYSKLEYDFFSLKDVNWFGKPFTHTVDNFMNEDYDLLLDLNIRDHFALKYIAALSQAKFKVGKYAEADEMIYDMMIDSDNTNTLKYFLRQVDTYIAMLNNPSPSIN